MLSIRRYTAVFCALLCLLSGRLAAEPVVKDVRLGVHPDMTRLVLDLSEKADFAIFSLDRPDRIVVDLPGVNFATPAHVIERKRGLIKSLRFGLFRPDMARLVLDLTGPAIITRSFYLNGENGTGKRLVLDLVSTDRDTFRTALKRLPDNSAERRKIPPKPVPYSQRPKRTDGKYMVVIDPGHGGVDPGAIGTTGVYEKQVTLSFARQLRDAIRAEGNYEVALTRDRDVFIELGRRVELARELGADLFISIHADSIGDRRVHGSGVYTLSERSSDKETAQLAAQENKSDIIAGVDLDVHDDEVANILIDLTRRETMNYSASFAELLVKRLHEAGRLRVKPHRFAGFRVLKAPDVPSVLIEVGYLSNRREERQLVSTSTRKPLVKSIAEAVDDYFKNLKK